MKSTLSAIRIIYEWLVKAGTKAKTGISGNIYWLNRPKDSKLEDIVVNSISLNGEAMQEGVFNVNIHIPNFQLANDNTQPNFVRMETICAIVVPILSDVYGSDYNFKIEEPGKPMPDGDNWFCNIRIRFWTVRSLTNNLLTT